MLDLVRAEDAPREAVVETGGAEGDSHSGVTAARRDTGLGGDPIECFEHAVDRSEVAREDLAIGRFEFALPVNWPAEVPFDLVVHVRSRATDEAVDDLGLAQWPSESSQDVDFNPHDQTLAVDEDPVAIEDHQVKARP